jgi:hypothetical protein
MTIKRTRTILVGIAIAVAVTSAAPILSATSSAGSLRLTTPVTNQVLSGEAALIGWTWRTGTLVKSTSIVDIKVTDVSGALLYDRRYRAARYGSWALNTTRLSDGYYAIRATIRGTSISSMVRPVIVDNTLPEIEITKPRSGDVASVDAPADAPDQDVQSTPVIAGASQLTAAVFDLTQTEVTWFLDGTQLTDENQANLTGTDVTYDFSSAAPGPHILEARVKDQAGLTSSDTVEIFTLPANASVDAGEVPNPEDLIPSEDPTLPVDPDNPPNPEDLIGDVPVDPDNPPVDPDNPPVDPDNPPVDPDNPPVDPDNPPDPTDLSPVPIDEP